MPEYLEKLRPDRDLQCYFERPSAIAALSETSAGGFRLSGCWRQQFDWAVLEWTRDNIFEHPAFRYLPDGDLSRLRLSYEETRQNCMAMDASWSPRVDWPYLRIWAEADDGVESLYKIALKQYATPIEGEYTAASAIFELVGTATSGDYVELAWLSEHYTYKMYGGDTLENAAAALANAINDAHARGLSNMAASAAGRRITLTWTAEAGTNGNRIGVYGNVAGAKTESWEPASCTLSGGTSPTKWRIDLNFADLKDESGRDVPPKSVRKLRWTWAADMQTGSFAESEFEVAVSNWCVTGDGRRYQVAGRGSLRVEDDSARIAYTGGWTESRGNFSGGSIRHTQSRNASASFTYTVHDEHVLFLGTRKAPSCGAMIVAVDGLCQRFNLQHGEDTLVRLPVGKYGGQTPHTVTISHDGTDGDYLYFDFLEAAVPTQELPAINPDTQTTLATDWDTDHSLALAPERTAWMNRSLGFTGRANHYAGAMWWYEIFQPGHKYASATVTFAGSPEFSGVTEISLGPTTISHVNLIGDTAESIAKAFELNVNAGTTTVWASATGATLTLHGRDLGTAGNGLEITATTGTEAFQATVSGPLAGGEDGLCRASLEALPDAAWCTELASRPVFNRAARDWHRSYFRALAGYGIPATAALSMELRHGDPSVEAGIAQRYPDGAPVWLNTPAVQTNFSPVSTAFWKQAYLELATLMVEAGQQPFLQFGEVQWWYFPAPGSGMPFCDEYTKTAFRTRYRRELRPFTGSEQPDAYPQECGFLTELVGSFTGQVMDGVRLQHPAARFEVLYPPDVNEPALNSAVNLPKDDWSPAKLDCFKTENFTFTGNRNLDKARESIRVAEQLGFPATKRAHLVGVGEYTTPWFAESQAAIGGGLESVVLFALDQFCFIGYAVPLRKKRARSLFMGR